MTDQTDTARKIGDRFAEAHTFTVYFLGKYRPASFQGPTFEAAFWSLLEATADMEESDRITDWASEIAAKVQPSAGRLSSYVSMSCEYGGLGLRWAKAPHDPWLDRALSGMPACPGLRYDLAQVGAARAAASLSGEA